MFSAVRHSTVKNCSAVPSAPHDLALPTPAAANRFLIAQAYLHSARPTVPTVIFSRFKQIRCPYLENHRRCCGPLDSCWVRAGPNVQPRTRDGPSSALGWAPEHC